VVTKGDLRIELNELAGYDITNGFRSAVTARAGGAATALWTTTTTPARTAGKVTSIYHIEFHNPTAGAVTAWLEIGGVAITVPVPIDAGTTEMVDYRVPIIAGDNDVNLNATANGVQCMITGIEV